MQHLFYQYQQNFFLSLETASYFCSMSSPAMLWMFKRRTRLIILSTSVMAGDRCKIGLHLRMWAEFKFHSGSLHSRRCNYPSPLYGYGLNSRMGGGRLFLFCWLYLVISSLFFFYFRTVNLLLILFPLGLNLYCPTHRLNLQLFLCAVLIHSVGDHGPPQYPVLCCS